MAKRGFSMGEALGEGFRLAGRRPLTIFVWGLIVLLPVFAQIGLIAGALMNISFDALSQAADKDDPAAFQSLMMPAMMQAQLADLAGLILRIIGGAAVAAAAYRMVLRPTDARRRPFGLGLGKAELRVGVTYLAVVVGLCILAVGLALILIGLGAGFWNVAGAIGRPWLAAALTLLFLALLLGGYSRVCLIPPASVADEDFAFESGWRRGGGHTGRLALMTLVIWVLSMVLTLAGYALIALVGWGVWSALGMGGGWPSDPQSLRDVLSHDPRILWLGGVLTLPLAWLYGLVMTLNLAPYASAVRQLTPQAAEAPAPVEDTHA